MDPLTPPLSTTHVSGNMSWAPVLGLLPSEPSFAFLQFSLYLREIELTICCISQAASPAWLASGYDELMGGKRWRLEDRIKERQGISPLCFWEHHCQCVLHGDTSAAILTCQALPHAWVPIALPNLPVLSAQEWDLLPAVTNPQVA